MQIEDEMNVTLRLFKEVKMPGLDASLWQDMDDEEIMVTKTSVLPIRPQTELVPSLCTRTRHRRKIVFQVGNREFIESLCTL